MSDVEVLQDSFSVNPKDSDLQSGSALGSFLNTAIIQFLSQNFEKLQRIFTGQTNIRVSNVRATTLTLGNYIFSLDGTGYLLITENGTKSMKLKNGRLHVLGDVVANNAEGELT